MNNLRRMATAFALCLTATGCADLTQPSAAPADATRSAPDLATVALATLASDRSKPYQLFIPDATRQESSAIVEFMQDGTTARYRFERSDHGWTVAEHLSTTGGEPHTTTGPVLHRTTWSGPTLTGTPNLAEVRVSNQDGLMANTYNIQPVKYEYVTNGWAALRWTQSGQVVSGYVENPLEIDWAKFVGGAPLRWNTSDSVFTVTQHTKWVYGDGEGQQGECSLQQVAYDTPCYPVTRRIGNPWIDAYYSIVVDRRIPSSVTISPSAPIELSPSQGVQLSATVLDQHGAQFTPTVTWTSSNTAVATVSASGYVNVVGIGSAVITATAGTVSATVSVTGDYNVTLSAPYSVYDDWATVTASMLPSGSYHYSWTEERCDYSTTVPTCSTWVTMSSGQDLTSVQTHVSRYDAEVVIKVVVRHTAGGAILDQQGIRILGAGEPPPSGGGEPCTSRICP